MVVVHYNENKLNNGCHHPARNLEKKWGMIKHDIAKFYDVHVQVVDLNISKTFEQDSISRTLDIYKHKEKKSFDYLHY